MTTTNQFQFNTKDVRIVLDERGEPLFVGKDVCEVLGYARPNDAINQHCKGAVKHRPLLTAGGIQEVRVLTEGDVMRLIVRSNLPAAIEFERLVFDEVLPSIRKTGKYRVGQKPPVATKRLPAIPDGDYPATITYCNIEKVRRVAEDPATEEDRFMLTVLIDAGEHAGLMIKTNLSLAWKTDEREQARMLIGSITKAVGLVIARDTSEFLDAKVTVHIGHKWHKSQRYNYVAWFKTRSADMPTTPALVNVTPLLAFAPPIAAPKLLDDKTKQLPNKQLKHPAFRVRKEKPAPIEYINDQQIKGLRSRVAAICYKGSGLNSFQVFNWLYNQMDIRDETRITKARLDEAIALLDDVAAGNLTVGGAQ